MKTFTIYHVPGYKVGATGNYKRRSKTNFNKYGVEPHIIEELELPDIPQTWTLIGDLEWEYADVFGYQPGEHYAAIRKKARLTLAHRSAGGKAGSFENRSKGGRLGGLKASAGPNAAHRQRVKCPHCDKVSTPGAIGSHIRHKHPSNI